MKKILTVLLALCLVAALTACAGNSSESKEESAPEEAEEKTEPAEQQSDEAEETGSKSDGKTLVVYFSATGTTKGVAEKIAKITGADIYEIKAAQEYTSEDLDWNDPNSRSSKEHDDESARPEIGSDPVSLEGYTTIYIGYPIWWGEAPRIMETFVESNDFGGITMIPFCTSGGSDIGKSGEILEEKAGSGNWKDGARLEGGISEDELKTWINGIK